MTDRVLIAWLACLLLPLSALAQQPTAQRRIDVLTGEPVQPPRASPRLDPEIFNAPHAPRQEQRRWDMPIDVLVDPGFGGDGSMPGFSDRRRDGWQPRRGPPITRQEFRRDDRLRYP